MKSLRRKKEGGFTLVELMIVIAIIGILAAIAIPQFAAYRERGFISSMQADVSAVRTAEEAYFADTNNNTYTTVSYRPVKLRPEEPFVRKRCRCCGGERHYERFLGNCYFVQDSENSSVRQHNWSDGDQLIFSIETGGALQGPPFFILTL